MLKATMDVVVCPDKFKGSLTARQVCEAIASGIRQHSPTAAITNHPMSDGGDGMLDVLSDTIALEIISLEIRDPLFRPCRAEYGISSDGRTAYIEMARASGLVLLQPNQLNCLETTTLGTGELIIDAMRRGVRKIVLGVGGSATNDGGMGVAAALGFRFLDANQHELTPIGKNLGLIDTIDERSAEASLSSVEFVVASDVQNVFFGADGAAHSFARQKGADDAAIERLDAGLVNLARVVQEKWGTDLQGTAGAGAAGGLGGGAIVFLGANLRSGVDMMIDVTRLEDRISGSNLVITGEGRLDEQTLGGKLIDGVVRAARKHDKMVAVVCGASTLTTSQLTTAGISYCTSIMTGDRTLQDAMQNAQQYIEEAAGKLYATVLKNSEQLS